MKKKILKLGDFERIGAKGSYNHYFSYKEGKYEICLEACLNGYCVGLYIAENLVQDKVCTNLKMGPAMFPGFNIMTGEALNKAIKIANELWNKRKGL